MFENKGVLLILDGLGDRPMAQLGGQTPLEAAYTPVMDRLITSGLGGLVHHVAPGIPVGTHTGCGLLMGLSPSEVDRLSRGLVQAVGAGVELKPDDVAVRCNFATLKWDNEEAKIIDRRAGRISTDTNKLTDALNALPEIDGVKFIVTPSTQHRVSVVLRGEGLSDNVSNTDPGSGKEAQGFLRCEPTVINNPQADRTAQLINAFLEKTHVILKDHPVNKAREANGLLPANALITRGAGKVEKLKNIINLQQVKTAVVSGEATLHGLASLFNFKVIYEQRFTATVETDLEGKVEAAQRALEDHDLVVLHIKGLDICAHDSDPVAKKSFIERIDAALKPLTLLPIVIGVTGDHSTDSKGGSHTGDPVPSFISASHIRKDAVCVFNESNCINGGLGRISSTAFLCTLLDQMNMIHIFRSHEFEYYL